MGRRLGRIAYYIVPRVRTIGLANLNLAYGDTISDQEKQDILMESMENLGILVAEFAHMPKVRTGGRERLVEFKGLEYLDPEKGGFMVGAHFCNWEWMVGSLSALDYKKVGVVRPLRDPRLNDAIEKLRGGADVTIVDKKNGGAQLIKAVREGHLAGALIDQSARENAVPVTFFGQRCWATIAPVMVAMRTRTPVYPVSMLRDEAGFYTMEFHEPIRFVRTGNIHQDLIDGSQLCQDVIESIVRKNPGQWLWIHDRWKSRPYLEEDWARRTKSS